jgi:hypothetical protein
MKHRDHLPTIVVFLVFVFGIALFNLLNGTREVSVLERRDLAQFPEITVGSILDGDFARDYAAYLQDQAAFRDEIRFLKSFVERRVFLKAENNGVYVVGSRVYDRFYGIRDSLVATAAQRMDEIADSIESPAVYASIIPTKAHALDDDRYLLSEQEQIATTISSAVGADYIDLMGLTAGGEEPGSYYGADPHWNTDGAIRAYRILAGAMGFDPILDSRFEVATDEYIGSEYGKAASWGVAKDTIVVAHNPVLDGMTFCRFRTLEDDDCYDSVYVDPTPEMVDLYDIFLGGLSPLMVITNEQAPGDAELVIFKDSYAHAIAPFLAQHYRKVSLVDLRYVQREWVLENVEFEGATTLFLYSTSVLNTDPRALN